MFKLKELRRQRGISQLKLSLDLNMGQNTISRYENEVREADYKTLILLADYFDTSIDYLLGRTDNPRPIAKEDLRYRSIARSKTMVADSPASYNSKKK